ncbi:E2 [Peromyscus papillomavirus 1]|uniref:Regulatory protein E2 n=1 Tax=Peromyscus papillomavirus 1 TaxID=1074206 RepID=G1C9I6_9PAPI|nr:E2 [Peromyscus papillomavirus 1]AEM05819.1 E2 [Peromyscus papillomavirus 1]
MESLVSRLSVVQEELMCMYERGEDTLESQVLHWSLIRKEQVLLHAARQHGLNKIGLQVVPPLGVTQTNAKNAIEMHLRLQSLANTPHAKEPWTLSETSREMYMSAPEQTFKKGGCTVHVYYDGNKENAMQYVKWRFIYWLDDKGVWQRSTSFSDHTGIYYEPGGRKTYYVTFAQDAARYSTSSLWEVHDGPEIHLPVVPVTSSTPTSNPKRVAGIYPDGPPTTRPGLSSGDSSGHLDGLAGGGSDTCGGLQIPDSPSERPTKRPRQRQPQDGQGPKRRKREGTLKRIALGPRETGEGAASRDPRTPTGPRPIPFTEEPSQGGGGPESPGGPRSAPILSPAPHSVETDGPAFGSQVGGQSQAPRRPRSPSPPSLLAESAALPTASQLGQIAGGSQDPPPRRGRAPRGQPGLPILLVCKGTANQVKCFRHKLKTVYPGCFDFCTTTWNWVDPSGSGTRMGRSRMLILCRDEQQYDMFTEEVKVPRGMQVDMCITHRL